MTGIKLSINFCTLYLLYSKYSISIFTLEIQYKRISDSTDLNDWCTWFMELYLLLLDIKYYIWKFRKIHLSDIFHELSQIINTFKQFYILKLSNVMKETKFRFPTLRPGQNEGKCTNRAGARMFHSASHDKV